MAVSDLWCECHPKMLLSWSAKHVNALLKHTGYLTWQTVHCYGPIMVNIIIVRQQVKQPDCVTSKCVKCSLPLHQNPIRNATFCSFSCEFFRREWRRNESNNNVFITSCVLVARFHRRFYQNWWSVLCQWLEVHLITFDIMKSISSAIFKEAGEVMKRFSIS